MTFTVPDQYTEIQIVANSQMHYEYALKRPKEHFEVRYSINPLDSVFIQFNAMKKKHYQFCYPKQALLWRLCIYDGQYQWRETFHQYRYFLCK